MSRHRSSVTESKSGWMPFYHGRPYWPLFPTKQEAVKYAKWKCGCDDPRKRLPPAMTVRRCTVKTTTHTEVSDAG